MELCRGRGRDHFHFHYVISWITDFRASVWLFYSRSMYVIYVSLYGLSSGRKVYSFRNWICCIYYTLRNLIFSYGGFYGLLTIILCTPIGSRSYVHGILKCLS
jgi:hypothetical protein